MATDETNQAASGPTVAENELGRRAFIGKLAWVTSGALIGSAAALETVSADADPSGPTGPGSGGPGRNIPSTGGGAAAGTIAAAAIVAGGAAAFIARREQGDGTATA